MCYNPQTVLSDRTIVEHMTARPGPCYLRWWYSDGTIGVSGGYTRAQAEIAIKRWQSSPQVQEVSLHPAFDIAADIAPDPQHGNRWYILATHRTTGLRAVRGPFRSRRAITARLALIYEAETWEMRAHYSAGSPTHDDPTKVRDWGRWALTIFWLLSRGHVKLF